MITFKQVRKKIHTLLPLSLIFLCILLLQLQYIFGKIQTPENKIYLGTVHFPPDYFYYLSQMTQGKFHFLTSTMLFTSEKIPFTFIGWQNVLMGKMYSILGIRVIEGYQISSAFFLFLFLILAYKLFSNLYGVNQKKYFALIFFMTSTSIPIISSTPSGLSFSYYSYWYNLGNMLARFGSTPHHLIAYSLTVLSFLIFVSIVKRPQTRAFQLVILGFAALFIGSINPILWGLTSSTFIFTSFISIICNNKFFSNKIFSLANLVPYKKRYYYLLPTFVFLLSGLPAAIYSKYIFSTPPYILSSNWESFQQISINPYLLFLGSGLIIPLGIIGIRNYIRSLTILKVILIFFLAFCSIFYFSGLPQKLNLSNARFWPSPVYITWAILATEGIFLISEFFRKKKLILIIVFSIYLITIIPTYFAQYKEFLIPKTTSTDFYIPESVYQTYLFAIQTSRPDDIFLIQSPFELSFSALTGRKSLFGYYLFTIDFEKKYKESTLFFEGKISPEESKNFFDKYKIKFLFGNKNIPNLDNYKFLRKVYDADSIGLYKVENG